METVKPDAFFIHLGRHFLKTAGVFSTLFNSTGAEILAENVIQKATFKAKENALRKILESAKEEATALQQPAVAPPQTST